MGLFINRTGGGVSTSTATVNFGASSQDVAFFRVEAGMELTSAALTNVSSYIFYKNGSVQTLPETLAQGDRVYIELTRTTPGTASSIEFTASGIANAITYAAKDYFYTRAWRYKENMTEIPDYLIDTDMVIEGDGILGNYLTNAISTSTLSGEFDILIPPSHSYGGGDVRSLHGLNDGTVADNVTNRYPRQRYGIFHDSTNRLSIYELGTSVATVTNSDVGQWWFKIEGRNTGGTTGEIKYYYSVDDKSTWTLVHTSTDNYDTSTDVFEYDIVMLQSGYVKVIPAQLIQL